MKRYGIKEYIMNELVQQLGYYQYECDDSVGVPGMWFIRLSIKSYGENSSLWFQRIHP